MPEQIDYRPPRHAGPLRDRLLLGMPDGDAAEWRNLFSDDRIAGATEAIILQNEGGDTLGLALVAFTYPAVVSYFILPQHRGQGRGFALLQTCVERVVSKGTGGPILIEPTSDTVRRHIGRLPAPLRERLRVWDTAAEDGDG